MRTRKVFLVVHLVSIGGWIGIDVAMGVLVFTALLTDSPQTAAVCYQALELVVGWPLLITSLVSLASGVALGLVTKYGLVRYWWVTIKLVLNVLLACLVLFALRPGLDDVALYGRQLAAGQPGSAAATESLAFPPIVSMAALLIAVLLSVYKPWGRIRKYAGRRVVGRSVREADQVASR